MSKFAIKCPNPSCGSYIEASSGLFSTGLFAPKSVKCAACGNSFNVMANKMASMECPHCKNTIIYDQSKGEKTVCPICHEKIQTLGHMIGFSCPSCSCQLSVNQEKIKEPYSCPLCETVINVQNQIEKERVKNQGLASIIKYEGGNDVFVWKHPIEDFNFGSQLIVHESQEAIFFKDGKALDLFGSGRYTLATQNLPVLEKLYQLPTNSDEIFHSEVYFINMTTQMGIKWGTDDKVPLFDPASGLYIKIGASGHFNLKVSDSRKLLLKVVGTMEKFTQSQMMGREDRNNKDDDGGCKAGSFKPLIVTKVKANLARTIKEMHIDILEIYSYLDILSEQMRNVINEALTEYGLVMPEFFITTVVFPDEKENPDFAKLIKQFAERTLNIRQMEINKVTAEAEQGVKLVEAQTAAQVKLVDAQAEAEAHKLQAFAEAEGMKAKGYFYQQETARKVGLQAMKNGITGSENGSGGLGDLAGLGVTLGAMGGVISMTKDALNPIMGAATDLGNGLGGIAAENTPEKAITWNCVCGEQNISSKFCPECGKKRPEPVQEKTWDCICGMKKISSRFCPECGAKRPEAINTDMWNCSCGTREIKSKFCPNCGAGREERHE